MKITTLYKSKPGARFFTSQKAAIANYNTAVAPYPAVELPDGSFRLIDSDAIVAADREVKPVTLYEAVYAAAVFDDDYHTGAFFLDQQSALRKAQQAAKCAGHLWISARENEAIPLPDGTYRRVREGDVVRLWEPEKPVDPAFERFKKQCGPGKTCQVPTDAELDEQLKAVVLAVASFGATQAAPESVEKPVGIFFYGEEVGSKLWVRKVFGRYERHAEITTDTLRFSTYAEALECLRKTLYSAHGAQCGWLPEQKSAVTATPESQAGAEQDAFMARVKEVAPKLHSELGAMQLKGQLIRNRVDRAAKHVKSILSLPAGPARAEAKLKLIGEISKL